MWFLGAVIGGIVGASAFGFTGFIYGAVAGGVILGLMASSRRAELDDLKKRVAQLETSLRELRESIGQSAPQAQPAAPPPVATESAPAAVAEPVPAAATEAPAAAVGVEPAPVPVPETPAEPATAIAAPAAPAGPSLWERLVGGNLVAKIGVVILFFGIAFLLKYAYERVHVPIELRLLGVAAGAMAMLVLGWRLRESKATYGLILQGGGVGALYLVVFGAFRLWSLLPPTLAFALLVGIAAASAILAVAQNSLTLAATGVAGGFLAPVLASTGQGSHVVLFSYYAVLNASIVYVAWYKAWRLLNLLGFAFTFVISLSWGLFSYREDQFATTEPFLVLFFLMYVAIPLLFARQRAVELKDYVDGTLVFGVPLVAFGLQVALVRPYEYGAAWSALALGAFYILLAASLIRRTGSGLRLLAESYIALGVAFATLAIPLAFDGRTTSASWAVEGAAVVWIGVRQGRVLARAFGYFLQFAAGVAFLLDAGGPVGATPVLNSLWMGCFFVAAGGLFCSAYLSRHAGAVHALEQGLGRVLLAWGALWWYGGGIHEIVVHADTAIRGQAILLLAAGTSAAASLLATRLAWPDARWLRLALYAAMVFQIWVDVVRSSHPFSNIGAYAWTAAFAVHFWLLSRHIAEREGLHRGLHAAGLWLLAIVGAREVGWWIDRAVEGARVWPAIAWALVPALLLAAVAWRPVRERWPVAAASSAYTVLGAAPLAVFLALWVLYVNFTNSGNPHPLPYVPVLNPLDVAIGLAFVLIARWLTVLRTGELAVWWREARPGVFAAFAAIGFVWVNGMLLRTLHHWAGLPFALEPMLRSRLVQASFSILWTLLALGAMVVATRRASRPVWICGAALMAVVVGKLLLVDMSGTGTVERIVSFIGVGVLMLVIGYFAPVPPKAGEREA